ncbi:hypothetical protein Bca4012_066302 [Brassica carinata]
MPWKLHLPSSRANYSAAANLGSGDEPARTRYRPRVVWSEQLHRRFVDAIAHLGGIDHTSPERIVEFMNVEGVTRAAVASHLHKYMLYLKKMEDYVS